jgi:NADH:ubiquinone oxidoreductase subunit 3 (subunit A)
LAEYVGVLAMLALAAPVVAAVWLIHRKSSPRPVASADSEPAQHAAAPGPAIRFGVVVLVMLVIETAVVVLIPWAIAARELGAAGLLGSALFVLPMLGGLLHAASRGPLE